MSKIRIDLNDLNDLSVESFDTSPAGPEARGTVHGHASFHETCYDYSCEGSCFQTGCAGCPSVDGCGTYACPSNGCPGGSAMDLTACTGCDLSCYDPCK